ncbi:MAG: VWA domain-containing protein [Deltaproteobacteria bacterium]|nr:VWA domain-containing protein [Deltaproteobacteria bacterium]
MLVDFLFDLRAEGLKVGPTELVTLARALVLGLHESTLDGFYDVARSLCVHREGDLDAFDRAFAKRFRGVTVAALDMLKVLEEWLRDPAKMRLLSEEERNALKALSIDELRKLLEERLREQKGRHEGGSKWIGSGGTSPFGTNGQNPAGVRIGGGGGRSALAVAEARRFRNYRSDVVLDVRAIEVALRKLRALSREGEPELDIDETIDATARQGGELEIVLRPPRKPNVKVLLLMDVGGSMDPHADVVSKLFSAAKRASNFKRLESYYFHNAIYGRVYRDANLREPARVADLMHGMERDWKLVVLGDALMHPSELLGGAWDYSMSDRGRGNDTALAWFQELSHHFDRNAWLNPEPEGYWTGTAEMIGRVFPMYQLTLDGLGEAVRHLSRRGVR